jgi:hypothetical protein
MPKSVDINEEIGQIFDYVKREFKEMDLLPMDYANACVIEFFDVCEASNLTKDNILHIISFSYDVFKEMIENREKFPP